MSRSSNGARAAGVTSLSDHPRFRADFARVASQSLQRARQQLGQDRAEFAATLTSLVGWVVGEPQVARWEEGSAPPGDIVHAAAAAGGGSLSVMSEPLLGPVPPAFGAARLAGPWLTAYRFLHARRGLYHADVTHVTAESDRHIRAVNYPPAPRTEGRARGFLNEIEAQLYLRHVIGVWSNSSDSRYFGGVHLAVAPGESVMVGRYSGVASDIRVSDSEWRWARVEAGWLTEEDGAERALKEPRLLYEIVRKQGQHDPPLSWGAITEVHR